MKAKKFTGLMLALSLAVTTAGSSVFPAAAQGVSTNSGMIQGNDGESRVTGLKDISLDAAVDVSFCSAWEDKEGMKKDWEPEASFGQLTKGWGCWDAANKAGDEQWVQYSWNDEITTSQIQIYWYADGGGTQVPATFKVQYKNASGEYVDANMTTDFDTVQTLNQYNIINFEEITTSSIKLVMTIRQGSQAMGIYRWKVMANVPMSEREVLELDKKALNIPAAALGNFIDLPVQSVNGYDVSWTSDHDAIKIENGRAMITKGSEEVRVKLTAVISGKEIVTPNEPPISVSKEFMVTVPKYYLARDEVKEVTGSFLGNGYGGINDNNSATGWNGWGDPNVGTQWIQYEFNSKMELTSAVIHWLDDERDENGTIVAGVKVPEQITFQYWDAKDDEWREVTPAGEEWKYEKNAANTYNFNKIITNKIKLIITNGTFNEAKLGAFIYEWALHGKKWEVSIEDLQTAIANAQSYKENEEKYTTVTFSIFKSALEAAEKAINENPSKEQIEELIVNLETAIDGLKLDQVEPGPGLTEEKKDLAKELSSAGKKIQTEYTAESWAAFDRAYKEAMAVNEDEASTKEQIDAALAKLQNLVSELVKKGSLKELQIELQKLTMPNKILENEIALTWKSANDFQLNWVSDHDAIKIENGKGIVTRGEEAVTVKLTVTITGKEIITPDEPPLSASREFSVLVPAVYLAKDASVTGSYEGSGTENLNNIKDENNSTAWNGWGRGDNTPDSDWIQYDFSYKLELTGSTIRWKDDGGGVVVPESITFQYYDGTSAAWKEVVPAGEEWVYVKDTDNTYKFEKIVTDKIKLLIHNGSSSAGKKLGAYIYEWGLIGQKWKPDLADLQAAITAAKDYDADLYTEESYSALTDAITEAEKIAEKPNLTETQITQAINSLQTAIAGLVKKTETPITPVEPDKSALEAAINEAPKEADKDQYTEESWEAYSKVLLKVTGVYNNEESTQTEIDQAVTDLAAAIQKLVKKEVEEGPGTADKRELAAVINSAPKEADKDKYTQESWKKLCDALEKAMEINNNAEATQAQVDQAKNDLQAAIAGLTEIEQENKPTDFSILNKTIENAKKYKAEDYTAASYNVLKSVLAEAEKTAKNASASQTDVNAANTKLAKAIQGLIKLRVVSSKKITLGVKQTYSVAGKNCTYTTSNKKTAAVNSKGIVTAKKTGKATIKSIGKDGKVKVYNITVKKAPGKILKVTPARKTLKKGRKVTLKVKLPKGTAAKLTFKSNKPKVASVNSKGVVKAKKKGTAKITVKTHNGKKKVVTIKVK